MKALLDEKTEKDDDDPNISSCGRKDLGIYTGVSQKLHNQDNARWLQFANFVVNEMTEADLNNSDEVTSSLVEDLNIQNIRGQLVGG